jgi:hypothetical protein
MGAKNKRKAHNEGRKEKKSGGIRKSEEGEAPLSN